MDDLGLTARIDDFTTIHVSPVESETYSRYVEEDSLGGNSGYFLIRTSRRKNKPMFEILAKAPTFEAAGTIFDMIVSANRAANA